MITANNDIQQTIIEVKYVLTMLKIKILDISTYIVINLIIFVLFKHHLSVLIHF